MNGWYVDEYTNQIKMAARPGTFHALAAYATHADISLAFTLRKNLNILGVCTRELFLRAQLWSSITDQIGITAEDQ